MTLKIALAQFNNVYGFKRYLPYCAGILKAYIESRPDLKDSYEFLPFHYELGRPAEIAERMAEGDVVGLSCYTWNWRMSLAVAEEIRRRNPEALIVLGGPAVPNQPNYFFKDHPKIDYLVHGEGEITFGEILGAHNVNGVKDSIEGTSYCAQRTGEVTYNPRRERIKDLAMLPSPYLDGVFDNLINEAGDVEWMGLWETNRGCPYGCTFCEWGGADTTKLMRFEMDRLEREIDWFGRNRLSWIFSADANFGILKRDEAIALRLAETKRNYGYPEEFRVCYTKNSSERIYDIAKLLNDEGMSKGVSLSMQSLNPETLDVIKRTNISMDQFRSIQSRFLANGMATFTELIMGLPGETYESFANGLNILLENGQHSGINIYNCSVLPNAEIALSDYRDKHGVISVEIPIFQPHISRSNQKDIAVPEREHITVGTTSLPVEDWRRVQRFAWAIQCFHSLGLLQAVALFLYFQAGITYRKFYESIVDWGLAKPKTLVGGELLQLEKVLDNVLAGVGFDQYVNGFMDISWPPEEASYLRISERQTQFFEEIRSFTGELLQARDREFSDKLLDALFVYQLRRCKHWTSPSTALLELPMDIHTYIESCRVGKPGRFSDQPVRYRMKPDQRINGNKKSFSRDVVWYGRKGGSFLFDVEILTA